MLSKPSEATRAAISRGAFMPAPAHLELEPAPSDVTLDQVEPVPESSDLPFGSGTKREVTPPLPPSPPAPGRHQHSGQFGRVGTQESIHDSSTSVHQPPPPPPAILSAPPPQVPPAPPTPPKKTASFSEKNAIELDAAQSPPARPPKIKKASHQRKLSVIPAKSSRRNSLADRHSPPSALGLTASRASSLKPLIQWSLETLRQSPDPLAQGLLDLIQNGAQKALFLIQAQNPDSQRVPIFTYSAAFQAQEKTQLWTGLQWDPRLVPDYWSQMIRKGYFELDPSGPETVVTSGRNVTRGAFGLDDHEWLTVMNVGPKEACRGLLAVVSLQSLSAVLPQALEKIQAAPEGTPSIKKSA